MTFRPELVDELLKDYRSPEDLMGESGIVHMVRNSLRFFRGAEVDATRCRSYENKQGMVTSLLRRGIKRSP
jgi:hypothetical protein